MGTIHKESTGGPLAASHGDLIIPELELIIEGDQDEAYMEKALHAYTPHAQTRKLTWLQIANAINAERGTTYTAAKIRRRAIKLGLHSAKG